MWFLVVAGATGWMFYNLYRVVIYFTSNPMTVDLRYKYLDEIPFPAITICNKNYIRWVLATVSLSSSMGMTTCFLCFFTCLCCRTFHTWFQTLFGYCYTKELIIIISVLGPWDKFIRTLWGVYKKQENYCCHDLRTLTPSDGRLGNFSICFCSLCISFEQTSSNTDQNRELHVIVCTILYLRQNLSVISRLSNF